MNTQVNILHDKELNGYDDVFPFLPSDALPELEFFGGSAIIERNVDQCQPTTFDAVRKLLAMRYDSDNFGSTDWNPLGEIITPGMKVTLKPNLVLHENLGGGDLFATIVHPSVIAAVCVYAALALKGEGEIVICDSSQWNCRWNKLMQNTRLDELVKVLAERLKIKITLADLRMFEAIYDNGLEGLVSEIHDLDGDPAGYSNVDLAHRSAMECWDNFDNIFGSDYNRREIRNLHSRGKHIYVVANSVLGADCVINLPKFKTHKKAGITCAMKNLVGTIGNKNCLPHFRIGFGQNGDEAAEPTGSRFEKFVKRAKHKIFWLMNDTLMAWHKRWSYKMASAIMKLGARFNTRTRHRFVFRDGLSWGNWHGNKTIGPLTLDLNTIFTYVDQNGKLCDKPVGRKMITIVDGIIGGQASGPLSPKPINTGIMMLSENSFANDYVAARIMGFDPQKVHTLFLATQLSGTVNALGPRIDDIIVKSNNAELETCLQAPADNKFFDLEPHKGWLGQIEIDSN